MSEITCVCVVERGTVDAVFFHSSFPFLVLLLFLFIQLSHRNLYPRSTSNSNTMCRMVQFAFQHSLEVCLWIKKTSKDSNRDALQFVVGRHRTSRSHYDASDTRA